MKKYDFRDAAIKIFKVLFQHPFQYRLAIYQ